MSGKADNKKELLRQGVAGTTEQESLNEIKKATGVISTSPSTTMRGQPMPSKELNEFLNVHVFQEKVTLPLMTRLNFTAKRIFPLNALVVRLTPSRHH